VPIDVKKDGTKEYKERERGREKGTIFKVDSYEQTEWSTIYLTSFVKQRLQFLCYYSSIFVRAMLLTRSIFPWRKLRGRSDPASNERSLS